MAVGLMDAEIEQDVSHLAREVAARFHAQISAGSVGISANEKRLPTSM
jgi:hypothetical protein